MHPKFLQILAVAILVSACSQSATGQLGHQVPLNSNIDSVSYGLGVTVGHDLKQNLQRSGLDSLNMDALFMGMRDAADGHERADAEAIQAVVQDYMLAAQRKMLAQQAEAGAANLAEGEAFLAENGKKPGVITTGSGLQYEVERQGDGPKPTAEQTVEVHYRGTLIDGTQFDSSYDRGEPARFPVNGVIPGWVEALQLMPVGAKWKLFIPSTLAYGSQGMGGDIPPNSTLIFEVELLDIVK